MLDVWVCYSTQNCKPGSAIYSMCPKCNSSTTNQCVFLTLTHISDLLSRSRRRGTDLAKTGDGNILLKHKGLCPFWNKSKCSKNKKHFKYCILCTLTLTGLEGHICPSLVKGLEGHVSLCCNIMVTSLWCHLEHPELSGAKKNNNYVVVRGTCALEVWWIMRRIGYHDK